MKHRYFVLLLTGGLAGPLLAGTILELPLNHADDLKEWNRESEKIAQIIPKQQEKACLEIRLERPVKNHIYGISRNLNPASIAGKRVTLSAEIRRDVKVYQKWQGGKLMLTVKHADGKYDYFGIYMEAGSFDWKTCSKSFDIPQDIVSATLFLGLQGGTGFIQYRNLKLEAGDTLLDLSKVVNMGYADPVAGDGRGGWSDQGPDNDASRFRWKQTMFGNVPFRLLDPAQHAGKSVMTFASRRFPNGLTSAEVDLSKGKCNAKFLYLLHTLTFPDSYTPIGRISISGSRGKQELRILNGRDVSNWWMPQKYSNAFPVVLWRNNGGNQVGVYLSKFKLNNPGLIRDRLLSQLDCPCRNTFETGLSSSEK